MLNYYNWLLCNVMFPWQNKPKNDLTCWKSISKCFINIDIYNYIIIIIDTHIAAIVPPPLTTHSQLWVEMLPFKPKYTFPFWTKLLLWQNLLFWQNLPFLALMKSSKLQTFCAIWLKYTCSNIWIKNTFVYVKLTQWYKSWVVRNQS